MPIILLLLSLFCLSENAYAKPPGITESGIEYLKMYPRFIVNLAGQPRKYLRIDVEVMVEGHYAVLKVKKHFPAIRHGLIILFSEMTETGLQTQKQREKLREDALVIVKKTLDKYAKNSDGVRDVFFTEFLVQ